MLLQHAGLLVLCSDVAKEYDWRGQFRGPVIDLRTDLGRATPA
jgi:hypothetical protein